MSIALARHRFTWDEYHKMAETGILAPTQRVELIEGEIVDMPPIGRRHVACVSRLTHVFVRGVGDRAVVFVQSPLRLADHSEPEPDLVVLRPRADFYAGSDAGPRDVLLVIEVADTSEHYDRHVKLPLYARHGIPEVWLVDLTVGSITAYRQPGAEGYEQTIVATGQDELRPLAFPDLVVTAASILP